VRIHGRRFVDRKMHKQQRVHAETRDAILWDIDWDNFIARCKIQGSNEYVNAHFPRNEAIQEGWMREGNAVRIIHRGGVRGYAEIVGHGHAIPTPLSGGIHPATSDLGDGVITGCGVTASGDGLCVNIADGTYRINEVTYTLTAGEGYGYYVTSESSPELTTDETYPQAVTDQTWRYVETDESDPPMETSEVFPPASTEDYLGIYCLDAAPSAGSFRYDAFVVGADGIIDYIKGTASSTPSKPSIPADHILLGEYILVIGGTTLLLDDHIGMEWTAPVASELSIPEQSDLAWSTGSDYPERTVTVSVKDQYGWAISGSYSITFTMISGTGQVYSADSGYDTSSVTQEFSGSSYGFKYQRDQTEAPNETSPTMIATSSTGLISNMVRIQLLDEDGNDIIDGGSSSDPAGTVQDLTSGSSVSIDWSNGHKVKITAGHDITFSFSGANDFDKLILRFTQDPTGGRTPTWPASVRYNTVIEEITISDDANSVSYVGFIYDEDDGKYDVVANVYGAGAS